MRNDNCDDNDDDDDDDDDDDGNDDNDQRELDLALMLFGDDATIQNSRITVSNRNSDYSGDDGARWSRKNDTRLPMHIPIHAHGR